jgi:hypothetical protein
MPITPARLASTSLAALALLASAVVLPGCATRADGSTVSILDDAQVLAMDDEGLSDAERRQLERVKRYASMRTQGAIGGAIIGGIAGALLVRKNRGVGAAGGALAGGALGYLGGAYVARLNETAEDRRDDLEVQLAAAKETVADTQRAVADNREIVRAERKRIERLNQEYRAGKITADQYRDQIGQLETRIKIVDESLRIAENDAAAMQKHIDGQRARNVNPAALEKQRVAIEREVATLRAERDSLIEAAGTIPAGVGAPTA